METDRWLSVEGIAKHLGVSKETISIAGLKKERFQQAKLVDNGSLR